MIHSISVSPRLPLIALLLLLCVNFATVLCSPIDNGLVGSELIKECASNSSVDLLLVLDGSGSIGDETFKAQLDFAASLAQRVNVSATGSHVAVMQYAETPQLEVALNQHTGGSELDTAIREIKYKGGATNTGQALHFALDSGFQGSRGGSVPKVLIVITDGQSQDDVAEPAHRLRDAHVLVYAIGVTNLVNVQQLHQMTGNSLRVFSVERFDQLDKPLADSITWDMCRTEYRPGTPDIICAPDKIGVRASTKKPFDGYVFVADHFHQPECRAGPEAFPDPKSIGITVPFNNCNVHRYRSLNPKGIFVEMTVVFMFHSVFMTKVDHTVKVQCFYMEAEKDVSVQMEVSMLTTQYREQVYQMPRCEYTLRKDQPNGPIVKYAVLGQKIYHRWECFEAEGRDTFGMLVHSCYVDNGYGDRVDILDENGCGIDAVLLTTPDYDYDTFRLATRAYHVFKYADRPVLQFQCQVTLCLKIDDGCQGVTPPRCPETKPRHLLPPTQRKAKKIRRARDHNTALDNNDGGSEGATTLDVFTRHIMIIDEQFAPELADCTLPDGMIFGRPTLVSLFAIALLNVFLAGATVMFWTRRRFSATFNPAALRT